MVSSAGADPLVRVLLRVRGLRPDPSLERFFARHGFETLERTPTSYVVGASGRPWRLRERPRPFAEPLASSIRIAASITAEPSARGRSVLATETRVLATDPGALRAFRAYWLVVGPFSSLIRRRWLAAAERPA